VRGWGCEAPAYSIVSWKGLKSKMGEPNFILPRGVDLAWEII
jgi:hypothetical protein